MRKGEATEADVCVNKTRRHAVLKAKCFLEGKFAHMKT